MADELNAAGELPVEATRETEKVNASEKDKHIVPEKQSEHSDEKKERQCPKSDEKTTEVANKEISETKVEDKQSIPGKISCDKSSSSSGSDSKSDSGSDSKSGSKSDSGSDSKSDSKSDSDSDSDSSSCGQASALKSVSEVEKKKKKKKKALKKKIRKTTKKTEEGASAGDKLRCDSSDSKSGSGDDSGGSKSGSGDDSGSGCESSGNKVKSKVKGANKGKKGLKKEENQPAVTEHEEDINVDKEIVAKDCPESTKETDGSQDDGKAKKGILGMLMNKLPSYSKNGGE